MLKDSDDDLITSKELEDLVCDEEEKDFKNTLMSKEKDKSSNSYQNHLNNTPTQEIRKKQVTLAGINRLDKFGFTDTKKKQQPPQRKTTSFLQKKNTPRTKIPGVGKEIDPKQKGPEMSQMSNQQIIEGLPTFLHPDKKRDKNKRVVSDPAYDNTTLYVPLPYMREQTPTMTQFWNIKMDNYDKILLFKLGKFYEIFFEDAIV